MASFLAIWESIVFDLVNSGIPIDQTPYNPAIVQKYMIPGSTLLSNRSDLKTFVSQIEIDAIFSAPMQTLALPTSFNPGMGSIIAGVISSIAPGIPSPPPSDNPNINGMGVPPPYLMQPPSQGITLPTVVGTVIDQFLLTQPPNPFPPPLLFKLPDPLGGAVIAPLVFTAWMANTPIFQFARTGNVMGAVNDAAWIRFIASSFYA